MFSRLASPSRMQFRSLRANLAGQRRRQFTVSLRSLNGSIIPSPSVNESNSAILKIVAEFKKAEIRITKKGVHYLQAAYGSELSLKDIKNSLNLCNGLQNEVLYGSAEPPGDLYGDFQETTEYGFGAWRSSQTYRACIDYNVFKIWEALYSQSDLFREIIEKDEEKNAEVGASNGNWHNWETHLRDYSLWEWLSLMLTNGIIEAADVDNLPEPYKLKEYQRELR